MLTMLLVGWIGLLPAVTIAVLCIAPRFRNRVETHLSAAHADLHHLAARVDVHLNIDEFLVPGPPADSAPRPEAEEEVPKARTGRRIDLDELLTPAGEHVGDRA